MNPSEWIAFLLNAIVACSAQPMNEQIIAGQHYQVQSWVCQFNQGPVMAKAWKHECDTGRVKYWGEVDFIEIGAPFNVAAYRNRFGEFQMGEGAMLEEAYRGPCGS